MNHFRVYNPTNPLITKTVVAVAEVAGNAYCMFLSSPIQAGKLFDVEIKDVVDLHSNVTASATYRISLEEAPDVDFNEIFLSVAMAKSGGAAVEWVELYNAENAPVCINGWSVANGAGGVLRAPNAPLCILPPGGHVVLAGAGADTTLFNEDIVLVCASTQLELAGNTLALMSPFGAQTDEFDAGAAKAQVASATCSFQKFTKQGVKSASWELDGPEFSPGRRGTPGFVNRRAIGTEEDPEIPVIKRSGLLFAAPNPFNPSTTICLAVKAPGRVKVKIYDVMGRVVRMLFDEQRTEAALLEIVWNGLDDRGSRSASGVYLVKMDAPDCDPKSLKITLLK
jgi:hypothetical protein